MRENKVLLLIMIIGMVIFTSTGNAQQFSKIAQTGMKWLSIPIGARAAALGNAYTAGTPDAGSVFWNPAGLALVKGGHVFVNQTQWIADINVNAASVSYEVSSIGTFGLHLMSVDWGTIKGTQFVAGEELFERTEDFSPEDLAVGISYARQISDKFMVGGNFRFLHEDLHGGLVGTFASSQNYSASLDMFAVDFGTLFYTGYKDLRLGMTVQNVSQEKKYRFESFPLPLTFKFGTAMDIGKAFFMDEESNQSVTLSVDAIHPRDFGERIHFGLEYGFNQMVFLRGGYKTNYDEEDLSLGGGLRLNRKNLVLGIDYSYLNFENFDAVHMFTFDFGF